MKLNHDIGLSRHNSIRAQANIELLDEKINLIGSLKAHREHCQRLETKLKNLEEQASNLPQVPGVMIETINELKHDVMIFSYPGDFLISLLLKYTSIKPIFDISVATDQPEQFQSESDLSCCGDVDVNQSTISSSHSMSIYGSESHLRSLLNIPYISQDDIGRGIIEEDMEEYEEVTSKVELSQQTSSNSECQNKGVLR